MLHVVCGSPGEFSEHLLDPGIPPPHLITSKHPSPQDTVWRMLTQTIVRFSELKNKK